ncbi:MAG: tyrosine-type recombinase/integrase [Planctomycetota bacterium]
MTDVKIPYDGFPLYVHRSGQYTKKMRGKTRYFGRVDQGWKLALDKFLSQRDDIMAGREPQVSSRITTVAELCNHYLHAQRKKCESGMLKESSWKDCKHSATLLCSLLGAESGVENLRPKHFAAARDEMLARFAAVTVKGHIGRMRAIFNWGVDVELLGERVRWGKMFSKPTNTQLRIERAAKPEMFFEAPEVRELLQLASPVTHAMILLGVNAAFGPRDCGEVEFQHLDLDGGWVRMPRSKTGITRGAFLWPETIAALHAAMDVRPRCKNPDFENRIFLTRMGQPFAKPQKRDNPLCKQFRNLCVAGSQGLMVEGRRFYALRHTFRTVADEVGDQPAIMHVMGHADATISGVYRERIGEDRLRRVADHVRSWLFDDRQISGENSDA